MNDLFNELGLFANIHDNRKERVAISGADKSYKNALCLTLCERTEGSVFFVCQNDYDAKKIHQQLVRTWKDEQVLYYPKEPLYFTFADSFSREVTNLRLKTIRAAYDASPKIIVTSIWALCEQRLFYAHREVKTYTDGDTLVPEELIRLLTEYGYVREERTEAAGQFSVRGGIIDYFSPSELYPIRIEFFGDEIDSIRRYDPDSQLSVEPIDSFRIDPFSDFLLTDAELSAAIKAMRKEADRSIALIRDEEAREAAKVNAAELFEKLSDDPQQAARLVYMYTDRKPESLLSLFPGSIVLLNDPSQLKKSWDFIKKSVAEDFTVFRESGLAFPKQFDIFEDYADLMHDMERNGSIYALSTVDQPVPYVNLTDRFNAACADVIDYKGNVNIFLKQLGHYIQSDYRIVLTYEDDHQKETLISLIETYGLRISEHIGEGNIVLRKQPPFGGMDFAQNKILIVPYAAVIPPEKKEKHKKTHPQEKQAFFSDIQPGDYVVHETHGIGRYDGIHQIKLEGVSKDYMKITYAKEDVLYVPAEQMDLIQKYIGASDTPPKLNRLGSADWTATKSKVSHSVKELAAEYIKMYAMRQTEEGYAFSPDTAWQKEFEEKFEYEPTEDQLRCTEEIKADMERPIPMDRLLCGDVGFGKTEVAQRAAFKAVMDSKQVAVLVPTTILALQHYNNFVQRFKGYPIKIEMMSRLRSAQQMHKTAENLRTGRTDIVVGTHRILSKDMKFKDLGLLIVDEEQRFGVAHKDKLKLMRSNVDTLTLSATPIPRTLHMSLSGIRDMSTIEVPPVNRVEVQTYVMEYDDIVIREAIKNELARGGQIFYVYNRVQDIERVAEHVQTLVPDARVVYAHGQMKEAEMERVILGFLEKESDVLVSTTIIENGVDIVNANTLIIEDADRLGLSQLYQLRGRVGRADTAAYAYMTYRKDKTLSELASKRLQSIKEFTKFGSGFKIAMRDLQVRGAGNLLGANQSGHFHNVGYEMYVRLLSNAIAEETGQTAKVKRETEIDLAVNAYIPAEYIASEQQRIELYKTIASIENDDDKDRITEEIIDVYSDVPESVANLLEIAAVKALAQKAGIRKLKQTGDQLSVEYYSDAHIELSNITAMANRFRIKAKTNAAVPTFLVKLPPKSGIIAYTKDLIENLVSF
ncbi:MAG: transcription-repair coupling factor [Anaerofustis sp.]